MDRKLTVLAIIIMLTGSGYAAQRETVEAVHLAERPTIDGHIEMNIWGEDDWNGDFRDMRRLEPANERTHFKMGHDATHLFLAARCDRPGMNDVPPAATVDGGAVWEDEGLEIFFRPSATSTRYYQIIVNAWGTIYRGTHARAGARGDTTWAPALEVATRIDAEGWTLEMAIPFADMDLDNSGRHLSWLFNIGRNSSQNSSFARITGGYHQPYQFTPMSFWSSPVLNEYRWALEKVEGSDQFDSYDNLLYNTSYTYTNTTGSRRSVSLTAQLTNIDDQTSTAVYEAEVADGQAHQFDLALSVFVGGMHQLELQLHETPAAGNDRLLRKDLFSVAFQRIPIEVQMIFPGAAEGIYGSQNVSSLDVEIRMAAALDSQIGRSVTVELIDEDGNRMSSSEYVLHALKDVLEVPAAELVPGKYRLIVRSQPDGLTYFHTTIDFERYPDAENEWLLTSKGVLLNNGIPFFPVSVFTSDLNPGDEELQALRDSGANVIIAARLPEMNEDSIARLLDACREAGIYVVCPPYTGAEVSVSAPLTEEQAADISTRVDMLRSHPAVMGYYIAHLPEDRIAYRRNLAQVAEVVRSKDPYRPLVAMLDSVPAVTGFSRSFDIAIVDACMISDQGRLQRPITTVTDFFKIARAAVGDSKALWFAPAPVDGEEVADAVILKNLLFQSIVHGAKGVCLVQAAPGELLAESARAGEVVLVESGDSLELVERDGVSLLTRFSDHAVTTVAVNTRNEHVDAVIPHRWGIDFGMPLQPLEAKISQLKIVKLLVPDPPAR